MSLFRALFNLFLLYVLVVWAFGFFSQDHFFLLAKVVQGLDKGGIEILANSGSSLVCEFRSFEETGLEFFSNLSSFEEAIISITFLIMLPAGFLGAFIMGTDNVPQSLLVCN